MKNDLQEIAKNLGISLNQLINLGLRDLRKRKSITIDLNNDLEISDFSEKEIKSLEKNTDFVNLTQKLTSLMKEKGL